MPIELTRLQKTVTVSILSNGGTIRIQFGASTPLLQDVMAEAEDYLRNRPYPTNDARITFLGYLGSLYLERGFEFGNRRLASTWKLSWRAHDEDGTAMRFCGNILMPKDVLEAVAYVMTEADLMPKRDPRSDLLDRLRTFKLL